MTEIPLTEIVPRIYQFTCLDAAGVEEAMQQARQISCWQAAPVRQGKSDLNELNQEYRSAKEIKSSQVAPVLDALEAKIHRMAAQIGAQICSLPLELSELRVVRYDEGDYFKAHSDTGGGDRRHFAIVVYLNDDFEGGATIFPLANCKVRPEAGKGVVFEANRLHRGDVIHNGVKYIAVMWLLDPQAEPAHD
jgi:predicted 2-oxoglutarate/Fe(II)-dependent dioxygenase YbiX